jgi:serine/threonine protein kinase
MSVDTYCQQPQLYYGVIPMPSDKEVLLQMATGLQYIHLQNLIHRDVKPGNILISGDRPESVLKWCDFGVSKKVDRNGIEWSSRQGTKGWMAPEVDVEAGNDQNVIAGDKSDIFSLGCVFFFFLTPAIHPFGNSSDERRKNIKSRKEPKNINSMTPVNINDAYNDKY